MAIAPIAMPAYNPRHDVHSEFVRPEGHGVPGWGSHPVADRPLGCPQPGRLGYQLVPSDAGRLADSHRLPIAGRFKEPRRTSGGPRMEVPWGRLAPGGDQRGAGSGGLVGPR